MTTKFSLIFWVILTTLLIARLAHAADPLLASQAYWVDKSGTASLNDAMKAPFVSFEGSLTEGHKPYALWIKLRLSGQESDEQLALIVTPAFIRKIELYDPLLYTPSEPLEPVVSGRDAEITQDNHIGLDNGFVINSSKEPRDIFLRITTTTSLTVDIDLLSVGSAEHQSQVKAGALSIYFAFLLSFLLWAFVNWAVRRDHLYGLFALRLVFSILHTFVWFGLFRYFLAGTLGISARDAIYNLVLIGITAAAATFDFTLISEFGVPRWLRRAAWSILGLLPICLILILFGHTQSALQLNSFAVILFLVMNVVLSFSARSRDAAPYGQMAVNVMRAGFSLMAIVVIVPVLMVTNILHISVPLIKIVFIHAAISTVILFTVLTIRARQKDLLAQQSLVQYEIQTRELQQESERREEKEQFLSMLVHELRNPLSVIRLKTSESSSGGKAVHQAVFEMAQIIERVEQSETIDKSTAQKSSTDVDLGVLLREMTLEHPASTRLDIDVPSGLRIRTDRELLRSIVRNLIDNAWKYSPDSTRIAIDVAERSNDGVIGAQFNFVNEVGEAGVPDAGKLFTKYYRSKGAHRRPGSGLGLFLVASWVKALGGTVGYDELAAANGSHLLRFSMWLPK